jgi:hypothetical protein
MLFSSKLLNIVPKNILGGQCNVFFAFAFMLMFKVWLRIWMGLDSQDWIGTVLYYTYISGLPAMLNPLFEVFFLIFWIKTGFDGLLP